jgi:predicted component of type VI protein secretion system
MTQTSFGLSQEKRLGSAACAELEVEGLGKFAVGQVAAIGRAPESQVVLNLSSISRNHARIFYEGGHYWIKDLDSANGTSINGKRVKLQMLSDQDRICFGDAKSVFRTAAARAAGPTPLGQDPLAGTETAIPDGTPTGELGAHLSIREGAQAGTANPSSSQDAIPGGAEIQALAGKIESLQAENELLQREIKQYRSTATGMSAATAAASDHAEIERLRNLVNRLERALADSNLRLRNLQQRLDGTT